MSKKRKAAKRSKSPSPRPSISKSTTEDEAQGYDARDALLELVLANRHKRSPDPKHVAFLAERIEVYRESAGKLSLDEVLGLKAKRGGASVFATFNSEMRDCVYFHFIAVLIGAGFTLDEAAEAIAEHQKHSEYNPTIMPNLHQHSLEWQTIRDRFGRDGGRKLAKEAGYFNPDTVPDLDTTANLKELRKRLISQLAPHLVPAKFKISGK